MIVFVRRPYRLSVRILSGWLYECLSAECTNATGVCNGADVNDEIHYDDYYESLLALVCRKLGGEYDKLTEFNFKIAEELVLAGAKINEYGFTYYNDQIKDDYVFEDYTHLWTM